MCSCLSVVSFKFFIKEPSLLLGMVEPRRLKEEDSAFEVSLEYLVRLCWEWAAWNVSSDSLKD